MNDRSYEMVTIPVILIVSLVSAIAMTCAFSVVHLSSNQLVYYVPYLKYFYPENFAADWFANSMQWHPFFGYVTIAMGQVFSLSQISLIGSFICWYLISLGLSLMVRNLYGDNFFVAIFSTVACLMTFGIPGLGGFHIGESSNWVSMFEPFFLASSVAMLGLGLFVNGQYLGSGLALSIGTVLHPIILVLSFSLLTVIFLKNGFSVRSIEFLNMAAPVAIVGSCFLLFIIYNHAENFLIGDDNWKIIADFRGPHHSHVWQWFSWNNAATMRYFGLILIQLGAYLYSRPHIQSTKSVALVIFCPSMIVILSTLAALAMHSSYIGNFQLAHLSPAVPLIGMCFVGGAFARLGQVGGPDIFNSRSILSLILFITGFSITLQFTDVYRSLPILCAFGTGMILRAWSNFSDSLRIRTVLKQFLWTVMATIIVSFSILGISRSDLISVRTSPEIEVSLWAKSNTPEDALFLVAPDMSSFRTWALRSIVVDFKSPGTKVGDWFRRLSAITMTNSPKSLDDAMRGFLNLNSDQVKHVSSQFGAQYFVTHLKNHVGDLADLHLLYQNDVFALFRVGD